jgi:hypothetical protein
MKHHHCGRRLRGRQYEKAATAVVDGDALRHGGIDRYGAADTVHSDTVSAVVYGLDPSEHGCDGTGAARLDIDSAKTVVCDLRTGHREAASCVREEFNAISGHVTDDTVLDGQGMAAIEVDSSPNAVSVDEQAVEVDIAGDRRGTRASGGSWSGARGGAEAKGSTAPEVRHGQLDVIANLMRRMLTRTSAPILSSLRRMVAAGRIGQARVGQPDPPHGAEQDVGHRGEPQA